jgi:hypothetical protein
MELMALLVLPVLLGLLDHKVSKDSSAKRELLEQLEQQVLLVPLD